MKRFILTFLVVGFIIVAALFSFVYLKDMFVPEVQADTEPRYYQLMERQTRALESVAGELRKCGCRP